MCLLSMCLLSLGAACGAPQVTRTPSPASPAPAFPVLSPARCADLVVLGVRGSGQSSDRNHGVGKEVLRTVTELSRLVRSRTGASLRLEAVPYDASGTATSSAYFEHVDAGARLARRQAEDILDRCPDTQLAAVGFSQGANVVHRLVDDLDPRMARRTVLVAMIADPQRDPADSIQHRSFVAKPLVDPGLLGPGPPVVAGVRRAAISLCTAGDEVCNAGGRGVVGGRTSSTHRFFYERPATARIMAAQLDRVLQDNGA